MKVLTKWPRVLNKEYMKKVISKDGTTIACEKSGAGPALILVDGALCHRSFGPMPKLAPFLAEHFTVYAYDRRGRGDSSDTKPYAIEREIEDIEALINAVGGSAHVFGLSSGAALVLEAANQGLSIKKIALYEAPFIVDDSRTPIPADFLDRLNAMLAKDHRGDAVRLFMKLVGMPTILVHLMRFFPAWSKLRAVAHTLPYDITIVKDYQTGKPLPPDKWTSVNIPTVVIGGGKSPQWMQNGVKALAQVIPNAEYRVLSGQTHMVKPNTLAPALIDFFSGSRESVGELNHVAAKA
jgi:pimeloyl-ACP methyl ester carboxylesterase